MENQKSKTIEQIERNIERLKEIQFEISNDNSCNIPLLIEEISGLKRSTSELYEKAIKEGFEAEIDASKYFSNN